MNRWRIGLGPVFAYERIAQSRRWQGFVVRSLFVMSLLTAFVVVWDKAASRTVATSPIVFYTKLASDVFIGVIGTQLALVLLAAPAATAGSICLDRSRGTLTHMLLTDLSDAEIVLGKLAVRLLPVLGLLACALPMMAMLTLMGGVDPAAIMSAFAVAASAAVVGCSLAMFLSLWLGKTHQALLGTYAILGGWLAAWSSIELVALSTGWWWIVPSRKFDPFYMALAPYSQPGDVSVADYLGFVGICGGISLLLITVIVLKVRAVCTREPVKKVRRARPVESQGNLWRVLHQNVPWITPSLDGNPVAWREWYRGNPSRLRRILTGLYVGVSMLLSAVAVFGPAGELSAMVNGSQVAISLLILSVWSATSLAEERVRGSLDLLMCTPLSTWQIVSGKWLGSFRAAPLLAILPSLVTGLIAYINNRSFIAASCFMLIYMLCAGAAVTSLGILMATWFSRLGRAVAVTVAVYALVTVGWLFLAITLYPKAPGENGAAMASPFLWAGQVTHDFGSSRSPGTGNWSIFWIGVAIFIGVALLDGAVRDFDRRLGRVEETLVRLGRPSRPASIAGAICFSCSLLLTPLVHRADWAIVLVIQFTLASVALAVMAASSNSDLNSRGGVNDLVGFRPSPARIVLAKWAGTFRYAPTLVMLPLLITFIRTAPDFMPSQEFLLVIAYLFAGCAAATSLGVAMFIWFRRNVQAVLIATLIWVLPIIPWFAAPIERPGSSLLDGRSLGSRILAMDSLDGKFISPSLGPTNALSRAGLWIAVYIVTAVLLLLAARAKFARMKSRGDHVIVIPREPLNQLANRGELPV